MPTIARRSLFLERFAKYPSSQFVFVLQYAFLRS